MRPTKMRRSQIVTSYALSKDTRRALIDEYDARLTLLKKRALWSLLLHLVRPFTYPRPSTRLHVRPSDVKSAVWGGLMTARAQARGVKGVVIDGRCRDLTEHRTAGFPARLILFLRLSVIGG
jgi:hypothetical protein